MEYDLICCVMSCYTIPKYNEQIKKINETWYNNNTDKVKYFGRTSCIIRISIHSFKRCKK